VIISAARDVVTTVAVKELAIAVEELIVIDTTYTVNSSVDKSCSLPPNPTVASDIPCT
jgi:hypothetical protein